MNEEYVQTVQNVKDLISPSGILVETTSVKIGTTFCKTLFILTYPRYLTPNWFAPIINLEYEFNISIFYHPIDNNLVLKKLRKNMVNLSAQASMEQDKGQVENPMLNTAIRDIEDLRGQIVQGTEKMFNVGVYVTLQGQSEAEVEEIESTVKSILEGNMIYIKPATYRHYEGFESALPLGLDRLEVNTLLNSSTASSLFPFVSQDFSTDTGIMYGVNLHNNSLLIFDRFTLPNANACCFGTTGSGKSFAIKLEVLRSLIFDTQVLVIDPENEYERIATAIGGDSFNISVSSGHNINPFDLPVVNKDESPEQVFRSHVLNLIGLVKLLIGSLTPTEEVILDKAIHQTYAVFDGDRIPLLSDLQEVLANMEGGEQMAAKLYKYTQGTYANFINNPTNINMDNDFIVFNIRDLEEELRPIAMYIVLNYIWNKIKKNIKKRMLVVDEAWYLLKHEESAIFLHDIAKRCRKYYLALTTITQDINDFMQSRFGLPIITNAATKLIFKQSEATIESLNTALGLNESEKSLVLGAKTGDCLFIAGANRAIVQIIGSYTENKLITTDPKELNN